MAYKLHEAVENGDVEEIERLAGGSNVNARDKAGNTPLRLAHTSEVARALLAKGADVNAANQDGLTPLHRAAMIISNDLIHLYLDHDAAIDVESANGTTPFLTAAMHGREYQMALLLTRGARPDTRNSDGRAAISEASAQMLRDALLMLTALDVTASNRDRDRDSIASLRRSLLDSVGQTLLKDAPILGSEGVQAGSDAAVKRYEQLISERCVALRKQVAVMRDALPQAFAGEVLAEIEQLSRSQRVLSRAEQLARELSAPPPPPKSWWHFWK